MRGGVCGKHEVFFSPRLIYKFFEAFQMRYFLECWGIPMKHVASACLFFACVSSLFSQSKSPVLMPGLGNHQHTISTTKPEAQRFFDQGLTLVFGFNHEEAARAFRRASELDPQSAMAFWGIALALGPCINLDVDPPHEKAAYEAVQKALSLAPSGTERERDYIHALATRYSSDPKVDLRKLDAEYADAMQELSKRYPDDLDAATLYAESLMDLHRWKLWSLDGRPTEGTEEILAVLESVLRRDPDHIGANHYFIHATEASPHPEWALASARRLESLSPAAGHFSSHARAHVHASRRLRGSSPQQRSGSRYRPCLSARKRHDRQHVRHDVLLSQSSLPRGELQHGRRFRARKAGC